MELNEGALVLCTVKKIEKTTIFLEIEGNGEGSMVLSEVAAGRIRNLREYVFPNKKIVCKVLSINKNDIQLSLRRVTGKERDEVIDHFKKEKRYTALIKTIIKEPETIINKIKEKQDFVEFLENARESPSLLRDFFNEGEIDRLVKMLAEKAEKEKLVKKTFKLLSVSSSGILDIKEILNIKGVDIRYLGFSRFSISAKAQDFKEANKKITSALEEIKQKAKGKHAVFEVSEK